MAHIWDYSKEEYEKQTAADPVWHLERLVNYGLNGEKLERETVKKYLPELKIPPQRRALLELLLYGTISSH